jgi:hypothetical protein
MFRGIPEITLIRRIGPRQPVGTLSTPPEKSCKGDSSFHHFAKIKDASSHELLFMDTANQAGFDVALFLAYKFGWDYRRPLRALRLNACDVADNAETP